MKISQEEIDQDAHAFVTKATEHFRNQRRIAGYEAEWEAADKSYLNDTKSFYKGLAKVRIPALHNAVEAIVPMIDKGAFPPDGNFFDAVPDDLESQALVDEADHAKALLKDQFRDIGVRGKLIGPDRSLCIYGTVFLKTYWEYKIKTRYKRDDSGKRIAVWETTYDNPDFYSPDIRDIFADIKDENLEGIVIERIVKDYQDLWDNREHEENGQKVGIYRNVDKLKETKFVQSSETTKVNEDEKKGLAKHQYGNHEHKIEVFECWGPIPKYFLTGEESDKEEGLFVDGLIVIAIGGKDCNATLRISDNPFDHQEKPIIRCRYIKIDGRLYGLGVMSVNIPIEAALNTNAQQALDCITKNLRPKWIADINAEIDENSLKDESDQVILSQTGVNGLQPIRPNDMTGSALALQASYKADLADGTGNKPILNGSPNNSSIDRTSVGVTAVAQGALNRIDLVAINYEEELLKTLVKHFWMLDQQFLQQGREVQLSGKGLVKVDPRLIPLPKINFVGMKGLGEKENRINQGNILLQNVTPLAQFGLDPVPIALKQIKLMGWGDIIPEVDNRPNSKLEDTPEGEVQLLLMGRKVKINLNDDHKAFIAAYIKLLQNAEIPGIVKFNTEEALGQRKMIMEMLSNFDSGAAATKNKKEIGTDGSN